MINVALIGTWHVHFNGYAREIRDDGRCRITALWDPDPEKGKEAAERYGCDFVADYDALLAREDVDAVLVCTSTDMHKDVMIKAANAGKHIFTEKVLCFTEADALEVKDAVDRSGVKFCISFPWRCRSDFKWVKQAAEEGLIGKVNYCRMRNCHGGASSHWLPDTFYDPVTCGGGAMMDLGAHPMYLSRWMLGKPVRIQSMFNARTGHPVEDNSVCVIEFENKAIAVAETGLVSGMNPQSMEVYGTKGVIICEGNELRLRTKDINRFVEGGWATVKLPENQPMPLRQFIDSVLYGKPVSFGLQEGRQLTELMENAYIADRERREVRF